jgi:hypothetical protein
MSAIFIHLKKNVSRLITNLRTKRVNKEHINFPEINYKINELVSVLKQENENTLITTHEVMHSL